MGFGQRLDSLSYIAAGTMYYVAFEVALLLLDLIRDHKGRGPSKGGRVVAAEQGNALSNCTIRSK